MPTRSRDGDANANRQPRPSAEASIPYCPSFAVVAAAAAGVRTAGDDPIAVAGSDAFDVVVAVVAIVVASC